jgi:hypothetical protein
VEFDFAKSHPFVAQYLKYIENTESPRLMHVWAALGGISAAMGRRCWYQHGSMQIWPNMYIILCGPPAVRKSTAFNIVAKLLRAHTTVRFAPDDTGGQRQGLIAAMAALTGAQKDEDEEIIAALSAVNNNIKQEGGNTTNLAELSSALEELGTITLDTRDPNTMYIAASELNSILGEGNTALLTFLQKMWDGEPYKYQLKATSSEINNALLGMIAATTPSQIAIAMPPEAVGQGFTSRAVFVYADKKHTRKIARPTLDNEAEADIAAIYSRVSHEFSGAFVEEPSAAEKMDELYERGITITDPRFVHYADRRHTHLQKLAMSLAASRGEQIIKLIDVNFADQLLLYTEENMPDALGEYGMNKLSAAKQKLLDFLKSSTDPIPTTLLYGMLSRDMTQMDFKNTIIELHNTGKITQTVLPVLGPCIVAVSDSAARKAKKQLSEIEQLMARG